MRWKISYSHPKQYKQHKHQQNKNNQKIENGKKNNCKDTSSDKQAKSYTRKLERGLESETFRGKMNLF